MRLLHIQIPIRNIFRVVTKKWRTIGLRRVWRSRSGVETRRFHTRWTGLVARRRMREPLRLWDNLSYSGILDKWAAVDVVATRMPLRMLSVSKGQTRRRLGIGSRGFWAGQVRTLGPGVRNLLTGRDTRTRIEHEVVLRIERRVLSRRLRWWGLRRPWWL